MSANQAGYATLNGPAQPLLGPHYTGAELPGGDRGACLLVGQQLRPTSGLQASNALQANGASGYAVTLPKATAPLVLDFLNVDPSASINIYALPGVLPNMPAGDPLGHFPDTIDALANSQPYVLAPGASVTFTGARGSWGSQ
jgi:hypothetical protein